MGRVDVTFVGVCTHFLDTVPGVPHRVVLPDASAFRFGITMIVPDLDPDLGEESTPNRATYYAMPHFSILRMQRPDVQKTLQIQGVMENGNVFSGVRLEIPNAIGTGVTYQSPFHSIERLTSYVEHYNYSQEVVLGGQAGIYFDLFSASVTAWPHQDDAIEAVASIETDGPPELLATPFFGGSPHRFSLLGPGDDPEAPVGLWVANQGMDCFTPESGFDFLLHYLTNRTGIPRRLTRRTPGMSRDPKPFSQAELVEGAAALTTFDFPRTFDTSPCFTLDGVRLMRTSHQPGGGYLIETSTGAVLIVSVACSNSQYP